MYWVGAFAIGLSLGLLGSGGSILTVPVLIYLVGEPEKIAIAESLAIVGLIAAGGTLPKWRKGLVDWKTVVAFGVPGMVGSYLGAWGAAYISGAMQLVAFSFIMLAAAVLMIRPPKLTTSPGETSCRSTWKIAVDGLIVGAVTGIVGVGGGFLIVPALVLLGGLSMHKAVGTSLAIIVLKSAAGFLKYQQVLSDADLHLDWQLIGTFGVVGFAGTLFGGAVGERLPKRRLQQGFGVFLVVMGIFLLWEYGPKLMG